MHRNLNLHTLLVRLQNGAATLAAQNLVISHKILNIELSHNLAITLLGIYPKEMKIYVHMKTCAEMIIAALFIRDKRCKP